MIFSSTLEELGMQKIEYNFILKESPRVDRNRGPVAKTIFMTLLSVSFFAPAFATLFGTSTCLHTWIEDQIS